MDSNAEALNTSQVEELYKLAAEVVRVLRKIEGKNSKCQAANAGDGRMEFAYVKYYLSEVCNLLGLSTYLLGDAIYGKYTYFPARQMMEVVLQQEHVYSIKRRKGFNGVRRLFFKDIASSAKSSLELPGEQGKERIRSQLGFLDIVSMLLKLDFTTENVSAKSNRDIKPLCGKSNIVIQGCTGSALYDFYSLLSESAHANVVSVGASNYNSESESNLMIFEISVELAIRFSEMVVRESNYKEFSSDIDDLNKMASGLLRSKAH